MRHAIALDHLEPGDPLYVSACYESPRFLLCTTHQAEDACSYTDEGTAMRLVGELRSRNYAARVVEALD